MKIGEKELGIRIDHIKPVFSFNNTEGAIDHSVLLG